MPYNTRLCTCTILTWILHPLPTHLRDVCPWFLCQQFFKPFAVVRCLTVNVKLLYTTTYDTTKTYIWQILDATRKATVCEELCACFRVARTEDIPGTLLFVFLSATMILCEWQSRRIIGSKEGTVLCSVSCTKVPVPVCYVFKCLHSFTKSFLFLIFTFHVVYHLLYSIPLSVSFRINGDIKTSVSQLFPDFWPTLPTRSRFPAPILLLHPVVQ